VEIIQLALQVVQAIAALLPWLPGRGHRMPEQSRRGDAMATKLTAKNPGNSGVSEYEMQGNLASVTQSVNRALKSDTKFVPLKLADGKNQAFIAADVIAIWEE
jgi:hypothetical protein